MQSLLLISPSLLHPTIKNRATIRDDNERARARESEKSKQLVDGKEGHKGRGMRSNEVNVRKLYHAGRRASSEFWRECTGCPRHACRRNQRRKIDWSQIDREGRSGGEERRKINKKGKSVAENER